MDIQFIRHATLVVNMKGIRFLVDPMLSEQGTMEASPNTEPILKNPIVGLPDDIELDRLVTVDAVLLTHTHRDHWDDAAIHLLSANHPIICQVEDLEKIKASGFVNVIAVHDKLTWNGIEITRTGARHGLGQIGEKMGPVSGFFLETANEPSLYITGDTVWCKEVEDVCYAQPDVIVAFAGGAQFTTGGPITMTAEDIYLMSVATPKSKIVAVHMEAWNHCHVLREDLRSYLVNQKIVCQVIIPQDGESMQF